MLKLEKLNGLIRHFKDVSWLFLERVLRVLSGLLIGVLIVKHLGPTDYGILSYVLAFVSIFAPLSTLGLNHIIIRNLVEYPNRSSRYLSTAFYLKFFGGILSIIAIVAVTTIFNNQYNYYIFIVSFGIIFNSLDVIDYYYQSKVENKFVSIALVIQLTISSSIKLLMLNTGAGLIWFVYIILFDSVIKAILFVWIYRLKELGLFFQKIDLPMARHLMKDAWPLMFTSFLTIIFMNIDKLMIESMLGIEYVGIYSSATVISIAFMMLPMIIVSSVFPSIIQSKKCDENLYKQRLQILYDTLVILALFIAIVITLISDELILLAYGISFVSASSVLVIYIWGNIFNSLEVASKKWFIVENLQKFILIRSLTSVAINMILNYYLIPIYGINGAAISSVVAIALVSFSYYFSEQLRGQFYIIMKSLFLIRIFHAFYKKD